MVWVRFHEQLCADEKVGLSRASRFVYMELSLKARPRRGHIILPSGLPDVKAVQTILPGGSTREVAEAIKALSAGDDPMIRFDIVEGKRALIVVSWEKWNPVGDDSRERVKSWRDEQKRRREKPSEPGNGNALHGVTETLGNENETASCARALLSSPLLSSGSDPERDSQKELEGDSPNAAERYIAPTDAITPELTAIAEMATVQDIPGAWAKFTGHYAGKWVHVAGYWQKWCVTEAKRERVERDRQRNTTQGRPQVEPIAPPRLSRKERQSRENWEREAKESPVNVAEVAAAAIAAIGGGKK